MKLFTEFRQYTPEWWAVRCGVPTASEFGRIVTPVKWDLAKGASGGARSYACQLIADRYDPEYGREEESYATQAMRNGRMYEQRARNLYELRHDVETTEVGFCLSDNEHYGCSPDALVGEEGVLEIKCPKMATHVKYLLDGGLPVEYAPQCHGHMIVTGRGWCDFISDCSGLPPLVVRVHRDEKTDRLAACLEQFWDMYQELLTKIEPGRVSVIEAAIAAESPIEGPLAALVPPDMDIPF